MLRNKRTLHPKFQHVLILLILYPWLVSFSGVDTLRNAVTVGGGVAGYDASNRDCSSPTGARPAGLVNAGASVEQRVTEHVGIRADAGVMSDGGGGRLIDPPNYASRQSLAYGKLFLQAQNNFINFLVGAAYWSRSTLDYGTLHLAGGVTVGNRDNWFVYAGLFAAPPEVTQAEWLSGGIGVNLGRPDLNIMAGVASGLYANPVLTLRGQIPFRDDLYFDVSGSLGFANYHEASITGGVKYFY